METEIDDKLPSNSSLIRRYMTKANLVLLCGLTILSGRDCLSADAPKLNTEQIKSCVLYAPKPYYPSRAAREYKAGAGTFLLKENPK
jgi:hypothetical protein